MELVRATIPSKTLLNGTATFIVEAGKRFVIETSPGGKEILDQLVPAGKVWTVTLQIAITEALA